MLTEYGLYKQIPYDNLTTKGIEKEQEYLPFVTNRMV